MNRYKLVALVAAVAIAAGACGGSSGSSGASGAASGSSDPLVSAMQNTLAAGSANMAIDENTSVNGQTVDIKGTGAVDFDKLEGKLNLRLPSQIGESGASVQMVFQQPVYYLKSPVFAQILPPGKSWLKMDLGELTKSSNSAMSQFAQLAQSDPSQFVDVLKGAVQERKVGTDTINGQSTTHYKARIDYKKAAQAAAPQMKGALQAAAEGIKKATGSYSVPVDVWVDSQGRLVREIVSVAVATGSSTAKSKVTIDVTNYGVDVNVSPPPGSQTEDILNLMGGG